MYIKLTARFTDDNCDSSTLKSLGIDHEAEKEITWLPIYIKVDTIVEWFEPSDHINHDIVSIIYGDSAQLVAKINIDKFTSFMKMYGVEDLTGVNYGYTN